ncbi:MAG: hypothetical protein GY797_17845 [Deltaproteobacteria bacterium]|nr:hypothetical protein [Deltaproteobacteria bacterium]
MDEDTRKEVELEANRVLSEETSKYREHLEKQLGHFKWAIIGVALSATAVFGLLFGKTYTEIDSQVKKQVDKIALEYRIKEDVESEIATSISEQVESPNTQEQIYEGVKNKVSEVINEETEKTLQTAVSQKQKEIEAIDLKVRLDTVPIGTIVSSVLGPNNFGKIIKGKGQSDVKTSPWVLADGRNVEGSKYVQISGTSVVPDLRGLFLRGLNVGRKDGKQDLDNDRKPGDFQDNATSLPKAAFVGETSIDGRHSHSYDAARPYNSGAGNHDRAKSSGQVNSTSPAGEHKHRVQIKAGGDPETRPKNVSVYYYIKIN